MCTFLALNWLRTTRRGLRVNASTEWRPNTRDRRRRRAQCAARTGRRNIVTNLCVFVCAAHSRQHINPMRRLSCGIELRCCFCCRRRLSHLGRGFGPPAVWITSYRCHTCCDAAMRCCDAMHSKWEMQTCELAAVCVGVGGCRIMWWKTSTSSRGPNGAWCIAYVYYIALPGDRSCYNVVYLMNLLGDSERWSIPQMLADVMFNDFGVGWILCWIWI